MPAVSRTLVAVLLIVAGGRALADDFERAPIHYGKARTNNVISRLEASLEAGKATLTFDKEHGYLPALLQALAVPESSQTLVFSKTSLQRQRISPKRPRAIYFADQVYVGYCQDGEVLEISAVDGRLGTVFYTLSQQAAERPKFVRHTDACLQCHASGHTRGVPGHIVRSVYPDRTGEAMLALGSFRVDQTTPLERRWGGWYVTGSHGKQMHLGNVIVKDRDDAASPAHDPAGQNVASLKTRCNTSAYLTPHSDIVALMVLEHQTEAHNLIARAGLHTRLALHDQALLNKELGRAEEYQSETTYRRIKSVGEPLVRYLLFSGEARLSDPVKGTSSFAADFAAKGRRDGKGRSLRDLDLQRRLFQYPCSYLIYSEAFTQLPPAVKEYVYERLHEVLSDRDHSEAFEHLSGDDRQAILEILRATHKDLPDSWRK